MPIDLFDLDDLLGPDGYDRVTCPACLGAHYVEDPYGPCPRCDRAGVVPLDSVTPEEERALLYADVDRGLTDSIDPEEDDDPDGLLNDEDTDESDPSPGVSS